MPSLRGTTCPPRRRNGEGTNAGQHVAIPAEQNLYPINDRPDAGCPAQIAMNNDPIIGGNLRRRGRDTFKQRVGVADKAGKIPCPAPPRIAASCIGIFEARNAIEQPVARRRC
jgi:hypothetical protein